MKATRQELLKDLQLVAKTTSDTVSRDYYREHGQHGEKTWHKFFTTFDEFLAAAGLKPEEQEKHVIQGDTWEITIPSTDIHTEEQLIEYMKIDLTVWKIDRCIFNKWSMPDGNGGKTQCFQVKAFCVRRKEIEAIKNEIDALRRIANDTVGRKPAPIVRSKELTGNMLEVNVPDAHFGKLSWPEETGYEPYDLKIASVTFMRAITALIDRSKSIKYDQVLFVVGNDLFNADDVEGRTTGGTPVTNDTRYYKVYAVVRNTIIWAIEELRKIAPVKVVMVSGNHDSLSVWHLGDSLGAYFRLYKDVEIDNSPRARKYHQFGKVMLMFTHGDKGKRTEYPLVMATEQPIMFGETRFRECHCGHTHENKLQEHHGVRVRVLPALCPPDDWHSERGFVGNMREAQAFMWNANEGMVGTVVFTDNAQEVVSTDTVVKIG